MSYFLQNLIIALNHGSEYALIALGYTMVYGVLRLINFAHGDVFMLGAFIGAYVAQQLNPGNPAGQSYASALWGIYCAMCFCGSIGFLIERFAYRPLRRSSKLSALITAIGVSLLIEYLAQMAWSARLIDTLITASVAYWSIYFPYATVIALARKANASRRTEEILRPIAALLFAALVIPIAVYHLQHQLPARTATFFGPTPQQFLKINESDRLFNIDFDLPYVAFSGPAWIRRYHVHGPGDWLNTHFGVRLITKDILVIGTTLFILAFLYFLIQKSRTGKAMRAVSQNYDSARLMGIDLNRIIAFTFVLGSMIAGIGGCLFGLSENQCTPLMGLNLGLKAFIAAVIGGIGNIPGAALGGLILGIIETYVSSFQYHQTAILSPYRDAVAFVILIAVLLLRPEGLLGKAVPEKV